jgi:hypothetical protein
MQYLFLAGRLEQASGSPAHRGRAIVDGVPRADIVPHAQLPATDPSVRQLDVVHFKKNIALLGLLLIPQPCSLGLGWSR